MATAQKPPPAAKEHPAPARLARGVLSDFDIAAATLANIAIPRSGSGSGRSSPTPIDAAVHQENIERFLAAFRRLTHAYDAS